MKKFIAQAASKEAAIQQALNKLGASEDEVNIELIQESRPGFLGIGQRDAIVSVELKDQASALDLVMETSPSLTQALEEEEAQASDFQEPKTEKKDFKIKVKAPDQSQPAQAEAQKQVQKDQEPQGQEEVDLEAADKMDQAAIEGAEAYIAAIVQMLSTAPYTIEKSRSGNRVSFEISSDQAGILIGHHGRVLEAIQELTQILMYNQAYSKIYAFVDVEGYRSRKQNKTIELAQKTAEQVKQTKQTVIIESLSTSERKTIHRYLSKNTSVKTYSEGPKSNRYLVVDPVLEPDESSDL